MECSVCYTDLTVKNIVNTKCDHLFCKNCFWKWADENNSCPMCRKNIISQTKMMLEEESIRNNIFSLMEEETKYYDSISYLQHELYELEDNIFELRKFRKNPEKYMNEFMKKRKVWIENVKKEIRKKKDSVIVQLNLYNTLYSNNREILSQIKFEKENVTTDIEVESIINESILDFEMHYRDQVLVTPPPRSEMQSPPPLIRRTDRTSLNIR